MKFEAYNYQCSPAEWEGGLFTDEAKQYRKEALEAMDNHLAIIDRLFTDEKVSYPITAEMPLPFKEGDTFRLLRLNARKRKDVSPADETEITRPYLIAKMLYAHSSFYVLTLQNVTMITREINWEKTSLLNMPSCIVIIANTEGRQLLLVESNKAFSSTKAVAKIFQDSLSSVLINEKLNINFRAHYSPYQFWEHMEDKMERGIGLKYVKFHFDYPNMADDAKLLAGYFEDFGVDMNAEMDYTIKGQHGQALNINPKERNPHMESIVTYAGKTGNKLQSVYFDKTRQDYDAEHVGISSLVAEETVRKQIVDMVQEALVNKDPVMIPLNDDQGALRDKIAVWLNGLNNRETMTGTDEP